MQLPLDEYVEITRAKETIQTSIVDMREELDQHLDAINQNTIEIQANYDYIEDLDKRMDKIESKLDQLLQVLSHSTSLQKECHLELSKEEKEIFFALYTSQEPLSYEEIAHRTSVDCFMVEDFLQSLRIKKVPLETKHFAGKTFVLMPQLFKERQAKEQLVSIQF